MSTGERKGYNVHGYVPVLLLKRISVSHDRDEPPITMPQNPSTKGSTSMKNVRFQLRPNHPKMPRAMSGEIPITYFDPLSLAASTLARPAKPPIQTDDEASTKLLRLTYDLSAVQADLALYQQWYGAAMQFLKEVRDLEASYAAVIGVFKQVGSQLRGCCDGDHPQLTVNGDQLGNLDRFHNCYHRAHQCYDEGLGLHRNHWTSIERACTRFEAQADQIGQEHRQSDVHGACHRMRSRP
jgi:hypothetical protein